MTTERWQAMGAVALGGEIAARRVDPRDVTEAYLDAIAAADPQARIYARTMPDRARAQAASAARRAAGRARRGPLDGVPVSWKDLFDTAGCGTEGGSRLLSGRVPARDAAAVAAGGLAGLVGLGKTHLSELAFSGLGYNPTVGTPPNVHDPDRVPGGSSSGAAVSVARGLAAAAVGSDTGGSVRVPAAWNGLVGLKTTPGRLPVAGALPLAPSFDTVGPIARSVADAAALFAALDGSKAPDLTGAELSGLRLGVLETVALDDLAEAQAAGFEAACARLSTAGARLERVAVPAVADAMPLAGPLYTAEAWAVWGETIAAAPERMFAPVRQRFEAGAAVGAAEWFAAWRRLTALRGAWAAATAGFDAVLTPTTPNDPPRIADIADDPNRYAAENLRALRNTRIVNLMGGAALTLPTGVTFAGLSLVGPPGSEARLLRIGAAAERALA